MPGQLNGEEQRQSNDCNECLIAPQWGRAKFKGFSLGA